MMMQILGRPTKPLNSKLLTSGMLILSLAMISLSWATMTVAQPKYYTPDPNSPPPKEATDSTGSRAGSCAGDTETKLTALAPQSHVGQTGSTHPTFAWFVPDSQPYPIIFQLYEYDANGNPQSIETINLQSSPGIMTLSLPKDKSGLSVGKRYRWEVVMLCNPGSPSRALVVEAEIERVEMPPALKTSLSATTDPLERAKLYASEGLWYDAMGEVLTSDKERAREFTLSLLENLVELETLRTTENGSEQSQRLNQIIKVLR
jgi:hypothetical protein